MNREIKFRGKRCDNGEWVYGYYVESNHSWNGGHPHKSWILDSPFTNGGWFALQGKRAVVENTVSQFTGLKDNNDKEIYEGDIIRFKYEDYSEYNINGYHHPVEVISAVTFEYGEFRIQGYPCRLGACYDWADDECEFEVIGNIYDNPELIKR